jgi:hypothetical protein
MVYSFFYVPEIGQMREYTLFLSFFLPRSGFVQQTSGADGEKIAVLRKGRARLIFI